MFGVMKTQLLKGIALASLVDRIVDSFVRADGGYGTVNLLNRYGRAGYGVGAALASVFYIPAKVTYAGLGLLTGGLGYVLTGGRADVANNIIYPAVRGNYVVTPNHLKGTEPLYFVGARAGSAPQPETLAAAPIDAAALVGAEANSALRRFDKFQEGQHIAVGPRVLFYLFHRQAQDSARCETARETPGGSRESFFHRIQRALSRPH